MKILYFGSACDQAWFDKIMKSRAMPCYVAQYLLETSLLDGISKIEDVDMDVFYLQQEQYYPKSEIWKFKHCVEKLNDRYNVSYIPGLNFPILKEGISFLMGMILTLQWIIKNFWEKNKAILTPFNYAPLTLGIFIIASLFGIKRVNIFTDMASDIMTESRQKDMILIKRIILPYYKKLINWLDNSYDGYILISEAMNEKVNKAAKPHIVMEGIFNNKLDLTLRNKTRAIMHAGTLCYEYGIKMFLDAFEQIDDPSLELWLFGDGDMRQYIEELCSRDSRVKYFGFKAREEVFEFEKKAILLINTRNPKDEYTKYSFPYKTFEYMVSGTPFLTTRLSGIKQEYYEYLYSIEEYTIEAVKQKIEEIIMKSQAERDDFGGEARKFVLENKNALMQAQKSIEFMNLCIRR